MALRGDLPPLVEVIGWIAIVVGVAILALNLFLIRKTWS